MSIGVITSSNKHNLAETISVNPYSKTCLTARYYSVFGISLFGLAATILIVFKKGVEQNWKQIELFPKLNADKYHNRFKTENFIVFLYKAS